MRNLMTTNRFTFMAATVLGLSLPAGLASAISEKSIEYDYWHQQHGEDHTGVLLQNNFTTNVEKEDDGGVITYDITVNLPRAGTCSAVVIGDRWLLSAAHCVLEYGWMTFNIGDETYAAEDWWVPTSATGTPLSFRDIAVIELDRDITQSIKTYSYNGQNGSTPIDTAGKEYEMVGWGNVGTGTQGQIAGTAGLVRRAGFNKFDVDPLLDSILPDALLLSDFDIDPAHPDFIPPSEVNGEEFSWDTHGQLVLEAGVTQGDSGGPDLIGDTVVGIHSFNFGFGNVGTFTDISGSIDVAFWSDWIDAIIAGTPFGVEQGTAGFSLEYIRGDEDHPLHVGTSTAASTSQEIADATAYMLGLIAQAQAAGAYGGEQAYLSSYSNGIFAGVAPGDAGPPAGGEGLPILIGDLDFDGDVDDTDLGILLANWQEEDIDPYDGNLDWVGLVGDVDLGMMLANWTGEITEDTIAQIVAVTGVPEPTTLSLIGLAALGLIRRRPNRR